MLIDLKTTAKLLHNAQDILILCHRNPDGDTVGSAMGLYYALKMLGKRASVKCADPLPEKFSFIYPESFDEFDPKYIVAVDTAAHNMLGSIYTQYPEIDLCIDHHPTNPDYAKHTLLYPEASATGEVMAEVIEEMGIKIDVNIANSLYTAIAMDTGCFRFAGTSSKTFFIAGRLLDCGADSYMINQVMFENKSRAMVRLECLVANALEYYEDGIVAIMPIEHSVVVETGVDDQELDGIASLPRNIEGVGIGITVKQRENGECRISVRTVEPYDASTVAARFGGGGHKRAAGCRIKDLPIKDVIALLVEEAKREIDRSKVMV